MICTYCRKDIGQRVIWFSWMGATMVAFCSRWHKDVWTMHRKDGHST